ncbi:DUF945 family protein [Permianibacter sp. IMCC34836]|uniref:DUF945 family protein n=1 Tax=Permianibacter fluminis TaxID=2738515 RepID=UPI0015530DA2|nr:DUF945 family protein [Permianibacter fluminis]NQD36031.1 DUF945 family protein [Permianibacter fluminis]
MKKWIPVAAAAAVVVTLSASAWYCGLRAEQALQQQLASMQTNPAIKLELANYERGLFRSHGALRIRLLGADSALTGSDSPVLFEQPFTVVHGPILWDSAFAFRPAAFGVKTQLHAQPEWPQDFKTILADERVRLISRIGFTGATHTQLRIAEGDLQLSTGTLALQRGELQVDYDPSDKAMVADLTWPGLHFSNETGTLEMADMGFHWAGTYYSQNLQIGSGDYHLGKVSAKQGEMDAFTLTQLQLSAKQGLDPSGEQVNSAVDMKLAGVNFIGQEMVKDGSMHLEINKLSVSALQNLDKHNGANMTPEQLQNMFGDLMALFQHGAELKIEPLTATVQGQPLQLNLLARMPVADANAPVSDPSALFQQTEIDLNLKAAQPLLAAWAPAELIALMEQSGQQDALVVKVRAGQITVNGLPYASDSSTADDSDATMDDSEELAEDESSI